MRPYAPLPANYIRILHLKWSIREKSPDGQLAIYSLDKAPLYDALSYVWGCPEPTFPFLCSGVEMRVPSNLSLALHRIIAPGDSRNLWIDQICVHQNDDEEKAAQVKMMDQIYSRADSVVVWLGEAPEGMDLALSSVDSIQRGLTDIGQTALITSANFERYGLPPISSPVWASLHAIFSSTWFERLWTLQEVVLARKIEVRMGAYVLDWGMLSSLSSKISMANLVNFLRDGTSRPKDQVDGFAAINHIEILRSTKSQKGFIGWPLLLNTSRTRSCTVDVDRIYAVMGLMLEHLRRLIQVDYKLLVEAVFLKFFKMVVEHDSTLYLLYTPCCRNSMLGLPSWCPNLCQPLEAEPLGLLAATCEYRAGCRVFPSRSSEIKVSLDSDSILVQGLSIDRVEHVVDLDYVWPYNNQPELARQALEWEAACLKVAQKAYKMPDGVPEAHWRTLIANKIHVSMPCKPNLIDDYHNMKNFLQLRTTSTVDMAATGDSVVSMVNFASAVQHACRGRRYFNTEQGYIGIAPADTKPGDVVCIFFSGPTPFIIRQSQLVPSYTFLGECYVYGLMNSEALDMMEQGTLQSETFELH